MVELVKLLNIPKRIPCNNVIMKNGVTYILIIILLCSCKQGKESLDNTNKVFLTSFVNPFIGTDGPGNTYPGATLPFGMVQLSPDIGIPGWDRIAGYFYQDSIIRLKPK